MCRLPARSVCLEVVQLRPVSAMRQSARCAAPRFRFHICVARARGYTWAVQCVYKRQPGPGGARSAAMFWLVLLRGIGRVIRFMKSASVQTTIREALGAVQASLVSVHLISVYST